MSQENVEASRRSWDRFLADDIPGTLAFLDPEIEVHDVPGLPDLSIYHGHRGFLEQIEKSHEAFSEITYEPLDYIGVGLSSCRPGSGVSGGQAERPSRWRSPSSLNSGIT